MKGFIYSEQQTFFANREVVGFGDSDFYVKEIDRCLANSIIKANHYSKKITTHSYMHLGVFINNELLGILQVGYAMNPASGGRIVENTQSTDFCELNRMWFDDKAERNSESKALSYLVRYIKVKYPNIRFMQSFADERCGGFGIVYQAANFSYYGEHKSTFWLLDGEYIHDVVITNGASKGARIEAKRARLHEAQKLILRQFRYIYWIKPKFKKLCKLKEQSYPKHY